MKMITEFRYKTEAIKFRTKTYSFSLTNFVMKKDQKNTLHFISDL